MPQASDTIKMGEPTTPAARSTGSAIGVFLVEDAPMVRDLIVSRLADIPGLYWAGFSDSEDDALSQLQCQDCDVLIVDIELRQGNGMSMLRKLSQSPSGSHAKDLKIVFSNNVCDAYRRAGARYGVHHFFDKSFQLAELHLLLERYSGSPPRRQPEVCDQQ
jgi:DNA-binding NarL/FixJ family response regulator